MSYHVDAARLEREWGIVTLGQDWLPPEFRKNFSLACDAQPAMVTPANGGIPFFMTMYTDPEVIHVRQAPNKGAEILGEQKMGTWETTLAMFPVVENTGEVAAYGDFNPNGRSNANASFPQRQSFLYQTVIEYGDLSVARAGEAKLNWISEQKQSASKTLNKFEDYIYHFGVNNLQNYGLLNDPALPAAVTPITKTTGSTSWGSTGVYASPNEIFNDFLIMMNDMITRTQGIVTTEDAFTFACSPGREAALKAINVYGLSAIKMITDSYPKLKIKTSARYLVSGVENAQLIADDFDGSKVGYCAFNEKLREHPLVRQLSSFQQKCTSGAWGAVWKYPAGVTTMVGI